MNKFSLIMSVAAMLILTIFTSVATMAHDDNGRVHNHGDVQIDNHETAELGMIMEIDALTDAQATGGISYPDTTCNVSPTMPIPLIYDVAMRMSEKEAERHEEHEHDHTHEWDEKAVKLARKLTKSANTFDQAFRNCMMNENVDYEDELSVLECRCGQEEYLKDLRKAYDEAMAYYPEWRGTILKTPHKKGWHVYLATANYAPASLGMKCANYTTD